LHQGGRRHLVYELVVSAPADRAVTLVALDADTPRPIVGLELRERMTIVTADGHVRPPADGPIVIPPAGRGVIYAWETLTTDAPTPSARIHHVTVESPNMPAMALAVTVPVDPTPARVFRAPLAGDGWFAANAASHASPHRRSLQRFPRGLATPQRYALDFVRVADDLAGSPAPGSEADPRRAFASERGTHIGDPSVNANYAAYGAEVLAMDSGVVVAVVDHIAENTPGAASHAVAITYATLCGNAVVVDHGGGYFATYAHLVPGRIAVTPGQRVAAGDRLGHVGNSGNASEPHLHLHVCDAPSLLDCHGRPYGFDHFVETPIVLAPGAAPQALPPVTRANAHPVNNAVVDFGSAAR
jgi:hypothetical protein